MPIAHPWKVLCIALFLASAGLGGLLAYRAMRPPQNQTEVLNRMVELARKGRYDKSVAVVQDWLNDSRRDSSHDWLLYQQIAMVYIGKAANKPATRTDSIHAADNSLEKALTLFDERPPKDNDVELFGIGGAYQMLGDVADDGKCMYCEKARRCFERQTSLIKGDYYTAQGTTVPLEPLRAEVRRHLQAINEKYAEAGCQAH